eukprot:160005_1
MEIMGHIQDWIMFDKSIRKEIQTWKSNGDLRNANKERCILSQGLREMSLNCYLCGKEWKKNGKLKMCRKCRMVYYCSKKCQKIHWKQKHRYNCRQFSGIYQHYNMKYVNDDTFCSKLP